MSNEKTDLWNSAPPSTSYNLPFKCPTCGYTLYQKGLHIGIFPYIYADVRLRCIFCSSEFNFCFPYSPVMGCGLTLYQSDGKLKGYTDPRLCPFHHVKLEIQRIYGDLTYKNKTKLQLKCPECNYYERVNAKTTVKKEQIRAGESCIGYGYPCDACNANCLDRKEVYRPWPTALRLVLIGFNARLT